MPTLSIAVIIPVYNVTGFLREAITSVVQQAYPAQEIILIDDGSNAKAREAIQHICSEYPETPLTCLRHDSNKGVAAARATGLAHCTADALILLDADDIMCAGSLEFFARFMEEHHSLIACYAQERRIDAQGMLTDDAPLPPAELMVGGKELLYALLDGMALMRNGGGVCIRTADLRALKINNQHLNVGEDWVMWCHLALNGTVMPAGARVVLYRRRHDANISAKARDNADLPFATIAAIYEHPAFKQALGEETMNLLYASAKNALHAYYASLYARNAQKEKAAFHFKKVQRNIPVAKGWQQED